METSQSCNALVAAAADYPRWVMFADNPPHCWGSTADPYPINADARTVAHARTSTGHPVRASFCFATPPAVSRLNLNSDDGFSGSKTNHNVVVAAHGDSVLVRTSVWNKQQPYRRDHTTDHFVYSSGDGTDRLPTLSLLPPCYIHGKSADVFTMERNGTGILRLGDGELVVATNLKMAINACDVDGGTEQAEAEFHVLRSSELQWKVERLPVRHDVNKGEVSFGWWVTDRVIPVAGRPYWVDLHQGILFSDVCGESHELRFMPLPPDPLRRERTKGGSPDCSRNLCATDGGAAVKFVLDGGMGWEKDSMVDSGELWALDAYQCLPRLPIDLPVVSIDDPNIICFFVSEHWHIPSSGGSKTTWVVMIDTRTKSLVGSVPISSSEQHYFAEELLPSQVSNYFNTSPGTRNDTPPASERPRRKDIRVLRAVETSVIQVPPVVTDCVGSPNHVILAALEEIPGMNRDEMLRAYNVLACDDRRRYRSLMVLPMDMRKDYCCMLVDMGTNK
ncbi:hypothetical protein ACQ4PT_020211 [Festuca glaucescens]